MEMNEQELNKELAEGDIINILPGQYLGRGPTKITITATVLKKYGWSYIELSALLVRCKPQSRPFMINLKHSKIQNRLEQGVSGKLGEIVERKANVQTHTPNKSSSKLAYQQLQKIAVGACPDCGATLWFQEGCATCHSCGFNKCG